MTFAGHRHFANLYTLTTDQEADVRGLFTDAVVAFFERAENQDWALVSSGGWLAVTVWPLGERSHRLEAKHLVAFVEDAKLVLSALGGASTEARLRRSSSAASG